MAITLFSAKVSASFLAGYSAKTFYLTVVLMVGGALRPIFFFYSYMAFQYETTAPDPVIKLIEAVVIKRHEENLLEEEELYRLLQEIIRMPDFLKAISGSSLKGSLDPVLDRMPEEHKRRFGHLDSLERRGFDVTRLREALVSAHEKRFEIEEPLLGNRKEN